MDPAGLRAEPASPRTGYQHCGHLKPIPSLPGQLIHFSGPRTQAQVTGKFGRLHGTSSTGPDCPGQLGDPTGPRTLARVVQDSWSTHEPSDPGLSRPGLLVDPTGIRKRARVTWDS